MRRIKTTIARSVFETSVGLIVSIAVAAIAISINRELPTVASVAAFGVVPSRSRVSSKSLFQQAAGAEQYKYFHRLPTSALFVEKRFPAGDVGTEFESILPEQETKHKNGCDLPRAVAGLALTLTIATTAIGGFPLPASAGFGPSSGATTTPPPNLKSITKTAAKKAPSNAPSMPSSDFDIDLDGKKLRILIDSALNVRRLEEFSGQLDSLIDSLKDSIPALTSDSEGVEQSNYIEAQREAASLRKAEREKELLKAQNIRLQVERQQKKLIRLENQPYWFNYFAAFVGSTASTLVMHPLDTIKTRLQVGVEDDNDGESGDSDDEGRSSWQGSRNRTIKSWGVAVLEMDPVAATTKETIVAPAPVATIAKNSPGNIGELYVGITGNLFKEVPPSAIYLGVYETVKYALSPMVAPAYLLWVYLVAGAAGETVGSIIRAPAEAVKSLVQSKAKDNALEAVGSVLGTADGRANVIRAWSASIGRDVPFGAIQLAAFETIKATILNNPNIEIDSSTLLSEAVIGAFAGGLGALVTNPTDVITTRIITQDISSEDNGGGTVVPLGVVEMGKKIYDEEGLKAFWKGWTARVGYWAPAISIFLTCYCSVRQAGITYNLFP